MKWSVQLAVFSLCVWIPATALAGPVSDSTFDGFSWEGAAGFAQGGSASADRNQAVFCPMVYEAAVDFNGQSDDGELIILPGLSDAELASLLSWIGESVPPSVVVRCADVNPGWLAASSGIVQIAQNDGVAVAVVDGNVDCDPGELLFASAHYYWDNATGTWAFGYGTNSAKVTEAVTLLEISGSISFVCAPIFDPELDVADFASSAPSVQVNHNPLVVGLTGLDTWFWYDFSRPTAYSQLTDDSVSVSAYGKTFTLEAQIWMDGIEWDVDCSSSCGYRGARTGWNGSGFDHSLEIDFADSEFEPAPEYDGGADTEDEAAGAWLYEEKGSYTLSTATHWRGVWTFNGLTYRYPPVVISDEVTYVVNEARGVLTTRDD